MRRWLKLGVAIGPVFLAALACAAEAERPGVTVFAAASLTESVGELASAYEKQTGVRVRTSFASSGTLARQIDAGAQADIFISADAVWMDFLAEHRRLVAGTRHDLVSNRLVLIAPADSALELKLGAHAPVLAALRGERLALADPVSVPAGRYAQAAFESFGIWTELEPHLLRGEDVRVALMWVARGEAPLGVVYATDALAEPRVRVVDSFPASAHAPIVYPMAVVSGASAGAAAFAAFLDSPAARAVFVKAGFTTP
jgi:molybdate transport system substrate-binding protein